MRQLPLLVEAAHYVGHPAIRNRSTIGGSIAHADPAAELPAVMVALSGNICRCTGYQHIVDAVRAAAQAMTQTSATTPSVTR